jgi:putative transposase
LIYKTIIIPVKCSKQDHEYLSNCNIEAAKVWNQILEIEKNHMKNNEGKWIDRNELQKTTKGIAKLHAKGIHHVCYKYLQARDSALKAKEGNGTTNLYPYRKKKFFVTIWDYQAIKIKDNKILLTKPVKIDEKGVKRLQKHVVCYVKNIPKNIAQIELIYRNGLKLAIKIHSVSSFKSFSSLSNL